MTLLLAQKTEGRISKVRLALGLILLGVFALYAQTLSFGFLDFDDGVHVAKDVYIRSLDPGSIATIFTRTISGVYIPLTSLSFALEYHFFGLEPFIYHLNNVLLYLLVVALVYGFGRRLGLGEKTSLLATLLFAIHPQHVESVAWVSERKDMLYAVFYIGALIQYIRYIKDAKRSGFYWALGLGFLSLLAKPTAATLPFILFLLDWWFKRPVNRLMVLDKLPFVLFTAPLIWITYAVQPHPPIDNLWHAGLIFLWSWSFYLITFFAPLNLSPYYPFVEPVSILNPAYALAVVIFALSILLPLGGRRDRLAVFASLFYVGSILIILRYQNALAYGNNTMVADRYMFLGGLGYCLFLGKFFADWLARDKKRIALIALALLVTTMTAVTARQCRIWKDDVAFFSAAIDACPTCYRLYVSRWKAYKAQGKMDLAEIDYRTAAALKRQQFTLP